MTVIHGIVSRLLSRTTPTIVKPIAGTNIRQVVSAIVPSNKTAAFFCGCFVVFLGDSVISIYIIVIRFQEQELSTILQPFEAISDTLRTSPYDIMDYMSEGKNSKITIYSTSWCAFCHAEMQWLDKLGIPYVSKNIETDKEAHEELMKKIDGNFRGVPVTDVAGDLILGFDRPSLQDAFAKHGIKPADPTK